MSVSKEGRTDRFRVEADMLAPIAAASTLLAETPLVLFEIPCAAGVPDIVLLELDETAMAERSGTEVLSEPTDVRVLLAMASAPSTQRWTAESLASSVGVSASHLKRTILPRLVDSKHLNVDGNCWGPAYRYRSLAHRVVTIEAKLRDWRRAVAQASRHTSVSDASWVALDSHAAVTAARYPEWFRTYGVGLLTVSVSGSVDRVLSPEVSRPRAADRELLVERGVALHLRGEVSGPLQKVFGNRLVASTGADPRLVGAGAS